jgi:tape measure domain-containing protein
MADSSITLGIKISADGKGAESTINSLNKTIEKVGDSSKKAASGIGSIEKSTKTLGSAAAVASRALGALSVAISARELVRVADAFTNLNSRLKLVTGTTGEFRQAMADVSEIANRYQANINDVGAAYSRMGPILAGMGKSQKDMRDVLESLSAAMKVSGTETGRVSEVLRQFSQALSGPTVQMEEMNTIIDDAGALWQGLSRQLPDVVRQYGSLKEAIGKGAVSNKDLLEATIRLRREFTDQASTMKTTVGGAFQVLNNEWEKYIGNANDASGTTQKFADGLIELSKRLPAILDGLGKLATYVMNFMNSMGQLFDFISAKFKVLEDWLSKIPAMNAAIEKSRAFSADPFKMAPDSLMDPGSQSKYYTGGGFGGEDGPGVPKFDGINRQIEATGNAADAAGGKVRKLKQDMGEGLEALARKWKLNNDQMAMAVKVYQEAKRIGVDPNFAVGLSFFESGLKNRGPNAAGARGPMQVIPGTFNRLKRDYPDIEGPNSDAISNIRAGLHYLKEMAKEFGSYKLAAAGYLAGEGSVRKARGMPHKVDRYTGVTTEQYADRVMTNAKTVAALMGGSDYSGWEKTLEDEQKKAFDLFSDRLDRQAKLADAERARELEKQKIALQSLGNEYKAWEDRNTLDIKFAVDQKSYEEQIQLINDAQTKSEDYIREMNRVAGGEDTARVQALNEEIKAIDQKIAKAKELQQFDEEDKLKDERAIKAVEREKEIIAAQSGNLDLQQALAENAQKYDAIREDAGRRIIEIQNQQMDIAQRLGGITVDAAKGIIDSNTEQLKSQVAINAAQREAQINANKDLTTLDKQREAIKGRLADTITVVEAEKQASLEKLAIDQGMLAYEEEILRVRVAATKTIQDRIELESKLAENAMAQATARKAAADIEVKSAQEIAKAQSEAANQNITIDANAFKEQQLELNAFWDQYMARLQDYASLWEQITGESANGWSKMSIAAGEYFKHFNQIGDYWKSDAGKSWGDLAPMMEAVQQAEAALAGMAKTLIALRSNYAEGSKGYKDMTSAAERLMEVQRVLAVVEGVIGVLHQLKSGDPYTAPARAAMAGVIVAAQLASIGMSAAAVPGFSNKGAQQAAQAGGSTAAGGGVFGDSSAKSESISKAIDIVAQNSTANLSYSAGMLRSLKNIELALAGTTNAIIRGVKPADVQGLGYKKLDPLDMLGIGKLIGSGVYTKITNWGIKALPQQLDQILAKGFQGMNWTEVTKSTKILGITISKSVKNIYSALDTGVTGQITRVIRGMADTVREAGKAFGISGDQFNSAMKGFVVNFGTLATKGLKGDELQKAVEQVFSSMSDDMAQQFQANFDLQLEPFMRAGQGMFETLVMVSSGINTATGLLAQFGMEAINYKDIIQKQGDVAAEIVRQSIVVFEGVSSSIGAYIDQAVGGAEELISVYRDLLIVGDVAQVVGFNMKDLTNSLIVVSGGVSQFLSNLQTYQTEIAGQSDYPRQILTLNREFGKLGLALPDSNRGFVKLVNSINTSTEAGQKLYAQVLSLADAFSKAQQEAAKLEELRAKYLPIDSMKGYRDQIEQVGKDFKDIIDGTLARMPGGGQFIRRNARIDSLKDRISDRSDQRAEIQEEIDTLEAKNKLTQKERMRLATLRMQRKALNEEIKGYDDQIKAINKALEKNPNNKNLLAERAKLLEEQGDALIKTLADIWDSMTQAINAAKETLKSIQDSIFELAGGAGGESIKYGMANARRITAESAYNAYSGNDIERLNTLADAYYKGIMDEYNAKMELIEAPRKTLEKERELAQKAHDEKIQALEKELGVARDLMDAVKGIQEYAKSLRLSSGSSLSPKRLLDEARKQYEDTLRKAQGGDVQAMRDITGASDAYLDAARKYFGSGGKYGQIFDGIVSVMDQLGMMQTGDADSIQSRIDALNKDHEVYLRSIDDQIAALNIDQQIKDLQAATVAKLQALATDLGPRITAAEAKAAEDMKTLIEETLKANDFNDRQLKAIEEIADSIGVDVSGSMPVPTPALPSPTDSWVQDIFDAWTQGQTGYQNPIPAFANGGMASPGMALVGERGPELVRFNGPGQVMTAEQTKKLLSGDNGETVAVLRELKTELKALVTTQSGANPQLIERLDNIERRLAYMERDQKLKPA